MKTGYKPRRYVRDLVFRVKCSIDDEVEDVAIREQTIFEEDSDGDVEPIQFSLRVVVKGVSYSEVDDGREAALYRIERSLPRGAYFLICHQCRFGVGHPFQGPTELWCLKFAPQVADEISAKGKRCDADLSACGKLPVSEFYSCDDFQRPLQRSRVPGSPFRV